MNEIPLPPAADLEWQSFYCLIGS